MNKIKFFPILVASVLFTSCGVKRSIIVTSSTSVPIESVIVTSLPENHHITAGKTKKKENILFNGKIDKTNKDERFIIEAVDSKGNKYKTECVIQKKDFIKKSIQLEDKDKYYINISNLKRVLTVNNGLNKKIVNYELRSIDEDNILETKFNLKIEPGKDIVKGIKLKEIVPSSKVFKIISRDENNLLYEKEFEVLNEGTTLITLNKSDYVEQKGDWRKIAQPFEKE